MGNCLVHEKIVRVMKTDGKILEYKTPIKVHQVLSEFTHHAISDQLPVIKHLHPNTELLRGRLYYLLPLPVAPTPVRNKNKNKKKKSVRFSDDVLEEEARKVSGVVRIKVLISKQELQAILTGEGVSVNDMISQAQKEPIIDNLKSNGRDGNITSKGWLPSLEIIPELI